MKEAIKEDYFESEIDLDTGLVKGTAHEVILSLFAQYGHVTPQEAERMRVEINSMTYNVSLPIDTIFNAVQSFGHYCSAAGVEESNGQAMAMILCILTNSGCLTKYLDE